MNDIGMVKMMARGCERELNRMLVVKNIMPMTRSRSQ